LPTAGTFHSQNEKENLYNQKTYGILAHEVPQMRREEGRRQPQLSEWGLSKKDVLSWVNEEISFRREAAKQKERFLLSSSWFLDS
jgi:hypothetical protein